MSNPRQLIAKAAKISVAVQEARRQTDCRKSIAILEELMTDEDIKASLGKTDNAAINELTTAYQKLLRQYSIELTQVSHYLAGQLDQLENIKTDDRSPISHTNMAYAFDNLAHFIVNEVITANTQEMQVIILKRWVNILHRSMTDGDFHTAGAINVALQTDAIGRLQTSMRQLTNDEANILKKANEAFIRDQGWTLMQQRITTQEFFIPALAGIKKTFTRAKETSQPSSSAAVAAAASSTTPTAAEKLIIIINDLKTKSKISNPEMLTPLQKQIAPIDYNSSSMVVKPIPYDENLNFITAVRQELFAIPALITKFQAELHKELNSFITKKRLKEPLSSFKKKLKKMDLSKILDSQFTSSKEFDQLEKLVKDLDATNSSKKANLNDIQQIVGLFNNIIYFNKRYARLQRESSSSTITASSSLTASTTSLTGSSFSLTGSRISELSSASSNSSQSSRSNSANSLSATEATKQTSKQRMFHRRMPSAPTLTTDDTPTAKKPARTRSFSEFSTFTPTPSATAAAAAAKPTTSTTETKHPRKASILSPRSSSANLRAPTSHSSSVDQPPSTPRSSSAGLPSTPTQSRASAAGLMSSPRRTQSPSKPRPSGKITKKSSFKK